MLTTRKRVLQSLDRWREAGWVTDDGVVAIRREISSGPALLSLSSTLAILGAVLIGFAAMSFVAANWTAIPRMVRVGILVMSLWAAYGGAGWLFARGYNKFAQASVVAGIALFGANIMLIAQMFHLDGNPPDAVLVWACGAVLAGFALKSAPAFVVALLLFGLWSGWETSLTQAVHWGFLPAWAITALGFSWLNWSKGVYLSGLALSIWIFVFGCVVPDGPRFELIALIGLVGVGLGYVASKFWSAGHLNRDHVVANVQYFGAALTFAGLFALQMFEKPSLEELIVLAVLTLIGLIAAMAWANSSDNRRLLWLAYAGFTVQVLFLYFKTVGTLLGSSLFFLSSGVIVIGLAVLAMRLHRRQEGQIKTEENTGEIAS